MDTGTLHLIVLAKASRGPEGLRFSESFLISQIVRALTCFETDLEGRSVQHDK